MKKYNLSNIMKRAWELVKKSGMTISSGLRKAWEEAKKIEKKIFKGRMEMAVPEADNNVVSISLWQKRIIQKNLLQRLQKKNCWLH